jgi:hypothetical protein
MSMQDYKTALELIESSGESDFVGPKSVDLVEAAERALALNFPPTYRRFLLELGCGDVGGEEFYGIIDSNFENSSVPNGIWLTLNERKQSSLMSGLVIIYATGEGNYIALDTNKTTGNGENPVVELSPECKIIQQVASDFGQFFLNTVRDVC